MTFTFDGGATGSGSASSLGVALTTTGTNDILFMLAKTVTVTVTSISDNGPGLTWQSRKSVTQGTTVLDLWYAVVNATFNATITANFSTTPGAASRVTVWGVSGVNTLAPFDVNASLPGFNSRGTNGTTLAPASAISTTNANTMLLAMVGSGASMGTITRPTGFSDDGIATGGLEDIAYQIVSSTQSSISPQYSWTNSINPVCGIWDAVQALVLPPDLFNQKAA